MSLAREAADGGAELVCLPEYCGGLASDAGKLTPPSAPESDHPVLAALRQFARERRLWILAGSMAITASDTRIVNRGFVIDADGEIHARYDKIHLFDVDLSPTVSYRESAFIEPGQQAVLVDLPWGRMGLSICYDLRFPQLYRELAQAGAEMLVVPAAFTKVTGEAHWHVLNRARAIENGCFVVSPCAVGPVHGGGASYGHSLIIDPWGRVVADGGESRGVISATIDLQETHAARGKIPALEHDRRFVTVAPDAIARAS